MKHIQTFILFIGFIAFSINVQAQTTANKESEKLQPMELEQLFIIAQHNVMEAKSEDHKTDTYVWYMGLPIVPKEWKQKFNHWYIEYQKTKKQQKKKNP